MRLTIFDVEHGACALLATDDGQRMLIDCGHNSTTDWTPGKQLQADNVGLLTMLVVTNYDEDHVSGLPDLLQRVNVAWLLRNPSVSGAQMHELKSEYGIGRGMTQLADMAVRYVPQGIPPPEFRNVTYTPHWLNYPADFDDENNLSCVLELTVEGVRFLFPGDLECAGWQTLLRRSQSFRDAVRGTHVLVAPHHGRESGICEELFDDYGCRPELVVISDDAHQYDTQRTVQYYASKAAGVAGFRGASRKVLTTRRDGDIVFRSQLGGGVVVE